MINLTHSKMKQFSYKEWIEYFANNDKKRLKIDFSKENDISNDELKLIFPSIQTFQKGEYSKGTHLVNTVKKFAQNKRKPEYIEAMRLFIKEENQHSAYLKKYMSYYNVKPKKNFLLDICFRKLRQLGGLKCEITVLVTAEIIALTYYDALAKSTTSPALKSICNQMLHDELPHIIFQSYTLSHFKNGLINKLIRIGLMKITLILVWLKFHKVYQAGHYNFFKYIKKNFNYLHQSILLVDELPIA